MATYCAVRPELREFALVTAAMVFSVTESGLGVHAWLRCARGTLDEDPEGKFFYIRVDCEIKISISSPCDWRIPAALYRVAPTGRSCESVAAVRQCHYQWLLSGLSLWRQND